jgi:hypothetical protein
MTRQREDSDSLFSLIVDFSFLEIDIFNFFRLFAFSATSKTEMRKRKWAQKTCSKNYNFENYENDKITTSTKMKKKHQGKMCSFHG